MIAVMQNSYLGIRVPRSRRLLAIATPITGLRRRAPRAFLTLMLLVTAWSNGTSGVSSLAYMADRFAGYQSHAAQLRIPGAKLAGGTPHRDERPFRLRHEL